MKYLFSRSLILCASTLVSLFIATQSAWGADAVVSGPIYANATANYYPQDILRAGNGEQCLDVTENTQATLSETFLDGTVLYSIDSDGRPITTENKGKFTSVTINDVATPCINDQRILVKFPKDVKSVTIYGYNKSDRTFAGVFISETAAKDSYTDLAYTGGTNSATKPNYTFEITLSNTEVANKYLWFKFSDAISIYRICYTPATPSTTYCIDIFNSNNNRREYFTASDNAGEYIIENFVVPDKDGEKWPMCWVGEDDAWNNSYSANWTMANIPLTANNDNKLGLAAGAIGTLHIWPASASTDNNCRLQFTPAGYGLCWGTGNWNKGDYLPFSSTDGVTYTTDLITLTTEQLSTWAYYVGYKTADSYVYSSTNSETKGVNTMCVYNATTTSWWSGNIGNFFAAGQKGKFRMWADNTAKNWNCNFIPYFTIVYDANYPAGANGQPADTYGDYVSLEESKPLILPDAPTAPTGYVFKGWTAAQDGSGNLLNPGETYDLNQPSANTILYAQWEKLYTVTYDLNGGSGNAPTQPSLCERETFKVADAEGITNNCYTFAGWSDGSKTYTAGDTYTMGTADVTLTAQWIALPEYTVTFNYNDEGATASTSDDCCEGNTVSLPTPTRDGFTFTGWYDAPTSGNFIGKAGASYSPTKDITLYAQWEKQNGVSIVIFDGAKDTEKTSTKGTNYSTSEEHSDGTTGFQWKLNGQKDNLVDVSGYTPSTYSKAIQQGGNGAEKNIMFVVPDGYALTLNIAYASSKNGQFFGLNKGEAVKADGSNCSVWNATIEAANTIYEVEIADLAAGTYYLQGASDACCFAYIKATVTSTVVKPVVEKKAPHRNYQIAKRTLRPYTSVTHYPLFDVTPKATAEYKGDKKWQPSYTIHAARTGKITAGIPDIDWVREDAKKGDTITLGANYEKLGTWLSTNGFGEANVGDTIMLTMRAVNACNLPDDATADSIPIILTDKYSLAYIVTGNTTTRKFYDITKSDTTDQLYKNLSDQYNVTPVSAYATYDYTNYEPYDLLLLTDYPKATGENAQPDYVNALADLVDKKPILSLKAHMSALPKWSAKGFTSNPIVPGDGSEEQAQKTLTVLCFSHDMFTGAEWDNADDRTLTILDNVYKDGNTYKGIQGFLAINSANFVNIATVYDAKGGRNLVACCERQDVTAARFIMLSINQGATQHINTAGQDAIDKLLKYLLWTEATNVSDCSLTFDNGEGNCTDCSEGKREFTKGNKTYTSGDHQWNNPANWNAKAIPTQLQNVRIEADCKVSGNTYGAGNVRIKEGKTLTIAPNGGLASVGQFAYYSDENWNEPQPIPNAGYIIVQAIKDSTGMLMHSHTDRLAATVQMYSPAYYEGKLDNGKPKRVWSYVAIPVEEGTVPQIFNGAYTYLWSEKDGWIRYNDGSTFYAFNGIALSQPKPQTFTFAGNLALAQKYEIELTNTKNGMGGMNLIGNSWTAPIQISKLKTTDFGEGLLPTVYIYSTGRDPKSGPTTTATEGAREAGYWTAIPVLTAKTEGWKGPKVIPAMQAFEVNFDPEASVTSAILTLDYDTIVRASGVDYSTLNQKLYAPGRNSTAEILQPDPSAPAPYEPTMLRIRVADTATCYNLHLLQGERFSEGFDNGWDGFYIGTDGSVPGLCVLTIAGEMQVSAQPEIDNTTLVFTPGKSDTYTFSFCLTETEEEPLAQPLYLNDIQLRKSCPIDDNVTYTFRYSENDTENRFVISHIAFEEQDTPTGIANLATVDQQLMLNNPAREALTIRVYDPAGRLCSEMSTREAMLQITLPEPQGVYMIHITGEQTEILRKIVQ